MTNYTPEKSASIREINPGLRELRRKVDFTGLTTFTLAEYVAAMKPLVSTVEYHQLAVENKPAFTDLVEKIMKNLKRLSPDLRQFVKACLELDMHRSQVQYQVVGILWEERELKQAEVDPWINKDHFSEIFTLLVPGRDADQVREAIYLRLLFGAKQIYDDESPQDKALLKESILKMCEKYNIPVNLRKVLRFETP